MANLVLPTVNSAAADANSVPAPVGSGPTNSAVPMVPSPEVLVGGSTSASTVNVSSAAVADPAPSFAAADQASSFAAADAAPGVAGEIGLAPQPIAGWQAADFTGIGQSNLWGPSSNAAWSAALGVGEPAPDCSAAGNVPGVDSFIGDSSMGDTLWYYASAGDIDDSQIASDQSTTGADSGDQSQSAAGGVVAGNGTGAAGWFTA